MRLSACRVKIEIRQFIGLMEEVRKEREGGEGAKTTNDELLYDKGVLDTLRALKVKLKQEIGE